MKEKLIWYNNKLRFLFFLACQLFFGLTAFAQNTNLQFEHITGKPGLPQNSIYDICQDKQGFLWFGTADGLCRYDGTGMKIFRNNPGDTNSLSGNFIRRLLVDSKGNIWIGTESGLCGYNPDFGTIRRVTIPGEKNYTDVVFPYCELPTGEILFGIAKNRFYKISPSDLKVTEEMFEGELAKALNSISLYSMYKCGNFLVFSVNNKIDIYNYTTRVFKAWPISDTTYRNINDVVNKGDSLYLATYNGVIVLNNNTGKYRIVKELNSKNRVEKIGLVNKLLLSTSGSLLIGTNDEGLLFSDPYLHTAQKYIHKDDDANSISFNTIRSLFYDYSGNLWIGTDGKGLNKCSISDRFNLYNIQTRGKDFLSGDFIRCFWQDKDGTLFIGTYGNGLTVVSPDRTSSVFYRYNPSDSHSLPDNNILCILSDSKNNIWIGTEKGIVRFNKEEKNFERIPSEDDRKIMVTSLVEISPGKILIGTNLLSHYLNTDSIRMVKEIADNNLLNTVAFSKDNEGNIYVAQKRKYFDSGKTRFKHEKNELGNFYYFCDAQYCYADENDNVWIATKAGLEHWNKEGKLLKTYTDKDGLPDNYLYSILPDNKGNLWISSNSGISKFNILSSVCRNFDITDGLQGSEFNSNAAYISSNGEFFLGGINGFNTFFPDSIKENEQAPINAITSCKIFNKEWVGDSSINSLHTLTLPYFENTITFTLSPLEFTQPEQNLISYRLLGLDTVWVSLGTEREISFVGIVPGNYVLEVKSCNNDGVWNKIPRRLSIRIVPPVWKTTWFLTLCCMLGIIIIVLVVRYLARRKLKAKLEEIKLRHMLEKERTRISQDMHDEIGSGLSKISILSELAGNRNMLPGEREAQMNKITSTSRQLVDNIQEIIWSLNPRNDTLVGLLSYMHEYANEYFDSTSIHLNFEYPVLSENETAYIKNTARRNIFLAFKETLNNIVKHSGATEVNIKFSYTENMLEIFVSDNGKGILDGDYAKNRNGLQNMKLRMKDSNGEVEIKSEAGKGTVICFKIKLEKEINVTT
ncbi:MAG TPA: two-component regulator propeller domain-containing protein [Bacteroidia bacterium]|nr:two-component regulator propeller domain-containing protein [Bacteroidia bacterium]